MTDLINYSALIDEAMHIIVKKSLEIVAAAPNRMMGDNHFFISFLTKYPGVILSEKLGKKYPDEMTIVLQYQFEDLKVEEQSFSVTLSFDNIKERITIPFASITAFADPSVKFGLQFRHVEEQFHGQHHAPEHNNEPNHKLPNSSKNIHEIIKESGATNVISLDSFRKKHD